MKPRTLLIALVIVAFLVPHVEAQSPRGTAEGKVGSATLKLDYGRPLLRGRDVMTLVVPGQLWRLGADDNTILTTSAPLQIGGKPLPAGRHTLIMKFVSKETWHFMALSKGDAFAFEPTGVVLDVPAKLETVTTPSEQLTLSVEGGVLQMLWGNRRATVPIAAGK